MPPHQPVTLIRQSPLWRYVRVSFSQVVQHTLKMAKAPKGQVAVVLMDDATIAEINHQFRSKNKPTNVLSFPSDEAGELGDILLAYETIAREAAEQGKSLKAHITHLLVHGTLHLLGYDHETDEDANIMESLEIAICSQLGIDNPYETR